MQLCIILSCPYEYPCTMSVFDLVAFASELISGLFLQIGFITFICILKAREV